MSKPNLLAIGGGTGLSFLLRGLKYFPVNLSAIVTMADDGASSGRLRRDYGVLPPGDVRQCLVALSSDEELVTKLFDYRFKNGRGLSGHSFGNLFLTALCDISGSFELAIHEASRILATKGSVIPSTLENINIAAQLENGHVVLGESQIPILGHRSPIKKIFSVPEKVKANKEALDAISQADYIIIGPGSLYTSIIPNLLIQGIAKAINGNKTAKKIYICNVSTERGETEKYSVEDHITALMHYGGPGIIDFCLVNNNLIHANGDEGKLGCVHNITTDKKSIQGIEIILDDIVNDDHPLFHDPKKVMKALSSVIIIDEQLVANC